MKANMCLGCAVLLVCVSFVGGQEVPETYRPQKEHEWLKQFVGEWDTESEAIVEPGQPPMTCKGTMKARTLGELWVVSDFKSNMFGTDIEAVQAIGFNPKSKKYVGTWIDSAMNHLWTYEGSLDETGKILTLEAEGPSFEGEGKTAKYRDIYEFKSKDHLVLKSSVQTEDGQWVTFMTGNMRRKK